MTLLAQKTTVLTMFGGAIFGAIACKGEALIFGNEGMYALVGSQECPSANAEPCFVHSTSTNPTRVTYTYPESLSGLSASSFSQASSLTVSTPPGEVALVDLATVSVSIPRFVDGFSQVSAVNGFPLDPLRPSSPCDHEGCVLQFKSLPGVQSFDLALEATNAAGTLRFDASIKFDASNPLVGSANVSILDHIPKFTIGFDDVSEPATCGEVRVNVLLHNNSHHTGIVMASEKVPSTISLPVPSSGDTSSAGAYGVLISSGKVLRVGADVEDVENWMPGRVVQRLDLKELEGRERWTLGRISVADHDVITDQGIIAQPTGVSIRDAQGRDVYFSGCTLPFSVAVLPGTYNVYISYQDGAVSKVANYSVNVP